MRFRSQTICNFQSLIPSDWSTHHINIYPSAKISPLHIYKKTNYNITKSSNLALIRITTHGTPYHSSRELLSNEPRRVAQRVSYIVTIYTTWWKQKKKKDSRTSRIEVFAITTFRAQVSALSLPSLYTIISQRIPAATGPRGQWNLIEEPAELQCMCTLELAH